MLISTEPVWIDQADQLASLCAKWQQQASIAVDTEFMRSDTFYPKVGLLQIGDGKACYLIDPLAIQDLQPLRDLLVNPQVTKVLHSCSEDMEVFQTWLQLVPNPIFDTQIAAAIAGLGYSLSYANLVKQLLNTEIPKDETTAPLINCTIKICRAGCGAYVNYLRQVVNRIKSAKQIGLGESRLSGSGEEKFECN
jgi:ribonuclease D